MAGFWLQRSICALSINLQGWPSNEGGKKWQNTCIGVWLGMRRQGAVSRV